MIRRKGRSALYALGLVAGAAAGSPGVQAAEPPADRCAIGGPVRTAPAGFRTSELVMPDGVRLSVHQAGEGRPVLMLHGWLASGDFNWGRPGIARRLVDAGYRVIMIDHRGHGQSGTLPGGKPIEKDQLARDGLEVLRQLGLADYDLVGYSIGGRTALRMVVNGARPRRLVLSGLGATTLVESPEVIDSFEAAMQGPVPPKEDMSTPSLLRKLADGMCADKATAIAILRSTPATSWDDMGRIATPTLLILGSEDLGIGPAEPLQAAIPGSQLRKIAGDHLSVLGNPELATGIIDFLATD